MEKTYLQEKKQHSSQLIPFSYYECSIPDYFVHVPLHWHGEFEINHIISGCAEFICGDSKFISSEGDIIIIPPNVLHAIYPYQDSKQIYDTIVFSPELLGVSENNRCAAKCIRPLVSGEFKADICLNVEHRHYSEYKPVIENIFSCAKGNTAQLDLLLKSELLRLFWLLETNGDIFRTAGDTVSRSSMIRPAIDYMTGNYSENITIEQLAGIVCMSKSYFMNCFKKAAGIGAIEYLSQLRIKRACEILTETDHTAAETAFECGFRNLSNFNRQFKKIMDCTPSEYRKLNNSQTHR